MTHFETGIVARELLFAHSDAPGRVEFHGNSMAPFLRDGDELVIEPVAFEDIRVGDVVTYRLQDKFPTYRVVKKRPHKLVLRADNWPGRIFFAWPEDVVGRVAARRRGAYRTFRDRTARGDFTDYCRACYETRIHTSRALARLF